MPLTPGHILLIPDRTGASQRLFKDLQRPVIRPTSLCHVAQGVKHPGHSAPIGESLEELKTFRKIGSGSLEIARHPCGRPKTIQQLRDRTLISKRSSERQGLLV